MSQFEQMLQANRSYAREFSAGDLAAPPSRGLAVVTCMDARLDPEKFLGIDLGEAHVIRNAGGRASCDAVRSLAISQQLQGTREVIVVHHTDCGMLTFENDDMIERLRETLGVDASGWDFMSFSDLEASVKEDVRIIEGSSLIPNDVVVRGAIYDVETGTLTEVAQGDSETGDTSSLPQWETRQGTPCLSTRQSK